MTVFGFELHGRYSLQVLVRTLEIDEGGLCSGRPPSSIVLSNGVILRLTRKHFASFERCLRRSIPGWFRRRVRTASGSDRSGGAFRNPAGLLDPVATARGSDTDWCPPL